MARLYALQKADMRAMEKQGVRENPIRRNGYALQGGASGEAQQIKQAIAQLQDQQQNATSVQRTMNDRAIQHLTEQLEHLGGGAMCGGASPTQPLHFELAAERAMEKSANRTNPNRKGATPTMGVSRMRGGKSKAHYEHDREGKLLHETMEAHEAEGRAMRGGDRRSMIFGDRGGDRRSMIFGDRGGERSGGRAVPSLGLSQFKGGSNGVIVGAGHGSDSDSSSCSSDSESDYEGGGRDSEIMARESARRPVIRSGLSAQHSAEAKEMGRHLGRHLKVMRGSGFFNLFKKGLSDAAREGASVSEETGMPDPNAVPPSAPMTTDIPTDTDMKGSALFHRRRDMLGDMEEAHEEHTARRFGRTRKGAGIFSNNSAVSNHPMRRYEPPTTDMGLKPIGFKPQTDFIRDPNRSGSLRQLKGMTSKGAGIFKDPNQQPRFGVSTPADLERHRQSEAETMETIRRGRDKYGMPKVITEEDRRRLADYDRRKGSTNMILPHRKLLDVGLGDCGGYLSGPYEGMGDELKFAKQRQDAAAKRRYAMAAARSRMTPAQKEAEAKKIAEGLALREKERPAREAREAAEKKKYDERMERVKPPTQVRKTLKPPAPKIPKLKPIVEGKGRRAPAGPNDGRRKRAEIVKRVMAEKGFKSMIEASRFVKEHNLY